MGNRGARGLRAGAGTIAVTALAWLSGVGAPEAQGVAGDRAALVALYHATRGWNWRNNTNWNSDTPLDEWYGVDTDGGGRVRRLLLLSNTLDGEIPGELGNLTELERLLLGANVLSGRIPPELGRLANLKRLELFLNFLDGEIPGGLGKLGNLEVLDLGDNGLLFGAVPGEFGDLGNLRQLKLRSTSLAGPLPLSLMNLRQLELLDTLYTGLCAPADPAFQEWLAPLDGWWRTCEQVSGTVPDAPTGLTVSTAGDGILAASWTAPANDGGSAISGYKVQWRSGAEDWDPTAREATSRTTAHDITGLTNGTSYAVRVAAVNAVGAGAWSAEAMGIPATPVAMFPPVAVVVLGLLLLAVGQRWRVLSKRCPERAGHEGM